MMRYFLAVMMLGLFGLTGWKLYQRHAADGGGAAGAGSSAGGRRRGGGGVAVEVTPIRQALVRDVRLFTGSLYAESEFVVAPKIVGRLETLMVDIGDHVESGQLIATLDDEEYRQRVEQSKAELQVANATVVEAQSLLDAARREYERISDLRKNDIAPVSNLDAVEAQYKAHDAKFRVAQALVSHREAALREAEARLSYAQIRVAWEGGSGRRIVGERFADVGAMLRANDPIVSILSIDSLKAVVHVIERDYTLLRPGQQAAIETDAFPGETFAGQIVRISPLLRDTSRQARVEIEVPNADWRLRPGMFVRARVEFAAHPDALVAPMGALVKRDGREGVFIADREKLTVAFVPVRTGIVQDNLVEILDPQLDPAATGPVVTLGQHLLEDGSAILLPGQGRGGGAETRGEGAAGKGQNRDAETRGKGAAGKVDG